ncbi:uncharacterized protein EDB91DRAFT_138460 [Suillus paluster]|uniref:uncharacterized protein n=1 Tax=Suillus paluster TaxID=48578 RepID=UPI001B870EE3|nr:uncharacterized protein EDB91DRAFT_138460 [Suillus paluster]KAG1746012.1 hypothetical protein EDB91DRAFT_138460 [Suillus paluster]
MHTDCTATESLSLEDQEAEDNLDLSLISSLEIDLGPHLGDSRVPDHLTTQLAKTRARAASCTSRVQIFHSPLRPRRILRKRQTTLGTHDFEKVDLDIGTTAPVVLFPRERFVFDLLFFICSNVTSGNPIPLRPIPELTILLDQVSSRKRVAVLCLPTLLDLCKIAMGS